MPIESNINPCRGLAIDAIRYVLASHGGCLMAEGERMAITTDRWLLLMKVDYGQIKLKWNSCKLSKQINL